MAYTISYHATKDEFLKWLIPTAVADATQDHTTWEALEKATQGFSDMRISITLNGIEVDAERVLEGLYTNMKHYAARAVRDQLRHSEKFQAVERARQTLDGHLRLVIRDIESEFPGLDFADEYW